MKQPVLMESKAVFFFFVARYVFVRRAMNMMGAHEGLDGMMALTTGGCYEERAGFSGPGTA